MKKILISSLVALILSFSMLGSYQRAHALVWALLAPAAAEAAYVGTMTAVFGGAALATAGIEYLDENLDEVEATARETWGLMSQDMRDNFAMSMEQTADGLVVGGNFISDFLNGLRTNIGTPDMPVGEYVGLESYGRADGAGCMCNTIYPAEGYGVNVAGSIFKTSVVFNYSNVNGSGDTRYGLRVSGAGQSVTRYYETQDARTLVRDRLIAADGITQVVNLINSYFSLSIVNVATGDVLGLPQSEDAIYNRVDQWLRDRADAGNLRLGIPSNTLVEPWANTATGNARVYENEDGTTDTMVLPDGVPIPRDQVNWRTRATGQATIDGVSVPVVVGADGALYNTETGERVASREDAQAMGIPLSPSIPREWEWQDTLTKNPAKDKVEDKPISIPGGFAGPTKPIAWDKLKMNAQALTTKFPFSIPWDLMRQLKVFDVGPETPVFEINIGDYLKIGEYTIPMNFDVDLSMFDKVAAFIRWYNLILWDIGLVLLIRKLLPE